MFFVFVMFCCLHVKNVVFLSSWLQWHSTFIKEYLLTVLELVGYGMHLLQYLKGTFIDEKLSFHV
jgi:hypothetical protein